jgi:hypothetical protein
MRRSMWLGPVEGFLAKLEDLQVRKLHHKLLYSRPNPKPANCLPFYDYNNFLTTTLIN